MADKRPLAMAECPCVCACTVRPDNCRLGAPMSVERIAMLWNSFPLETDPQSVVAFARAIEAHHGITSKAAAELNKRASPGQQWKQGDEFLPFHQQASHVSPEYRDGWNRCYWMAVTRVGVEAKT